MTCMLQLRNDIFYFYYHNFICNNYKLIQFQSERIDFIKLMLDANEAPDETIMEMTVHEYEHNNAKNRVGKNSSPKVSKYMTLQVQM